MRWIRHRLVARRVRTVDLARRANDLADVLDDAARRCSTGEGLTAAMQAVLADRPPWLAGWCAAAVHGLRTGAGIEAALSGLTTADAETALFVHVVSLCARNGGRIAESLDRAAATLRERSGLAAERQAQSAQAQLSARVLTLVPVGFAAWTMASTPSVRRFAFTPLGLTCVVLGVALNLVGWRVMRRTIGAAA